MRSCSFLLLLIVASNLEAQAQSQRIEVVTGQVVQYSGSLPTGLTLEARSADGRGRTQQALVAGDGSFRLQGIEPGQYELTLMSPRGEAIQHEFVYIGAPGQDLKLRIRTLEPAAARPVSSTISSTQLLHPVPPKAAKKLRLSEKAFEAGNLQKSIKLLEQAIEISPDYMQAYNNLGVRYMSLHQFSKAAEEFHKAVTLDPNAARAQLNLSVALSLLRRFPEAEEAARRALQLDPKSASARVELGQALVFQNKITPEALEVLRQAAEEYPGARLLAAQVLARQGNINEAATELREYLKSGNSEKRAVAEEWLAHLSRAPRQ